jgi:hypothetical protein
MRRDCQVLRFGMRAAAGDMLPQVKVSGTFAGFMALNGAFISAQEIRYVQPGAPGWHVLFGVVQSGWCMRSGVELIWT